MIEAILGVDISYHLYCQMGSTAFSLASSCFCPDRGKESVISIKLDDFWLINCVRYENPTSRNTFPANNLANDKIKNSITYTNSVEIFMDSELTNLDSWIGRNTNNTIHTQMPDFRNV